MLHACDQRFNVTGNLENFCELKKAKAGYSLGLKATMADIVDWCHVL
jgi:hypothetical protein